MSFSIIAEDIITVEKLWNNNSFERDSIEPIKRFFDDFSFGDIKPLIEFDGGVLRANDVEIDFSMIKAGEDVLSVLFDEIRNRQTISIVSAVLLLDSIYHTQTYNALGFAVELKHLFDKEKPKLIDAIINANKESDLNTRALCVKEIATIMKKRNGRYAYSFATKFCNWINPEAFPIIDSYVAWLLRNIMYEGKPVLRNSFGKYDAFINAYDHFMQHAIENGKSLNYKQIDTFMWTVGKIIGKQSSVTYIEPEGNIE